ncbi:MAG: acetyltransferase [Planctomycetota bacterium]|nr:acetyltransferase [Planctomycetota bacterium]
MSRLLVLGAGGNGRVVADIASIIGDWHHIAFLDDHPGDSRVCDQWEVLGPCAELRQHAPDFDAAVVAFGDNALRERWFDTVLECDLEPATIVAPTASVSPRCLLGPGTIVMPQAVVNVGSITGRCCLVNTASTIDHDCCLGDAVHVSPGANLGGGVRVGDRTWIGIGASVNHEVTIGKDVVVGGGAAVVADLPDACCAVGVPARPRS